jgi:hypothetical protein
MSKAEALWFIVMGFILGWGAHAILLQIAYRMNIVEYKGSRATHQGDHK